MYNNFTVALQIDRSAVNELNFDRVRHLGHAGHVAVDQPQQTDNRLQNVAEVCNGSPEGSVQNCFVDIASLVPVVALAPPFIPLLTDNSLLNGTLAAQQTAYSNVGTVKPCVNWLEKKELGVGLEKGIGEVVVGENLNDLLAHRDTVREVGKLAYPLQCQVKGMSSAMQCE